MLGDLFKDVQQRMTLGAEIHLVPAPAGMGSPRWGARLGRRSIGPELAFSFPRRAEQIGDRS